MGIYQEGIYFTKDQIQNSYFNCNLFIPKQDQTWISVLLHKVNLGFSLQSRLVFLYIFFKHETLSLTVFDEIVKDHCSVFKGCFHKDGVISERGEGGGGGKGR